MDWILLSFSALSTARMNLYTLNAFVRQTILIQSELENSLLCDNVTINLLLRIAAILNKHPLSSKLQLIVRANSSEQVEKDQLFMES